MSDSPDSSFLLPNIHAIWCYITYQRVSVCMRVKYLWPSISSENNVKITDLLTKLR